MEYGQNVLKYSLYVFEAGNFFFFLEIGTFIGSVIEYLFLLP